MEWNENTVNTVKENYLLTDSVRMEVELIEPMAQSGIVAVCIQRAQR